MMNLASDWAPILIFFPVWAFMAGVFFGLVVGPKKVCGSRMRKLLDSTAMMLSLASAAAVVLGMKCESFINLPLTNDVCRADTWRVSLVGLF